MHNFKRTITWILLIFIAAAIVTMFRSRPAVLLPDGLCVLFWHSQTRCPPCRNMEEMIHNVLSEHEGYRLFNLEYDVLAYQSLAQEFNVGTITIILVERKDRQHVRWRDLTIEIQKTAADDAAFVEMLQRELKQFREGE